jgi:hypothetical protein
MTPREILVAFEREIGVLNDYTKKPTTDASEYWINLGIDKFVKTRYSGYNIKLTAFEQDEKRYQDLKTLIVNSTSTVYWIGDNKYETQEPLDILFTLDESVSIVPMSDDDKCWPTDKNGNKLHLITDVTEATLDTYHAILDNALSEYHWRNGKAKPVRVRSGNTILLFTDGTYQVETYYLHYLRRAIKYSSSDSTYTDLPEHTHLEVVKLAAQLYLENQTNPRYQSISNEVNSME